jgi:hypothetical protein
MTKHDPIDVEVTHVEEHGDAFQELEHPDIDPEMTSGIAIVTPEQFIDRTPSRRKARAEQMKPKSPEQAILDTQADDGSGYTFSKDQAQLAVIAIPSDNLPAVRVDPHGADHLEWAEDYSVLRVLFSKVFRRAIIAEADLPEPPSIEEQVIEALGDDLTDAFFALDEALDQRDDVSVRLAEWKAVLGI